MKGETVLWVAAGAIVAAVGLKLYEASAHAGPSAAALETGKRYRVHVTFLPIPTADTPMGPAGFVADGLIATALLALGFSQVTVPPGTVDPQAGTGAGEGTWDRAPANALPGNPAIKVVSVEKIS